MEESSAHLPRDVSSCRCLPSQPGCPLPARRRHGGLWACAYPASNLPPHLTCGLERVSGEDLFLSMFSYSCPHFSPIALLCPTHPPPLTFNPPPPHCLCPPVLYTCSLMTFPLLSPVISLPAPLRSLPICSLFPCLWFYFARLFVLLIRLHLWVRLYSICPSLPCLFHLA